MMEMVNEIDISNLYEVEEDWKRSFITDIMVIDLDAIEANGGVDENGKDMIQHCHEKEGFRDLFEYTWSGMRTVYAMPCDVEL